MLLLGRRRVRESLGMVPDQLDALVADQWAERNERTEVG